MKQAIGEVNDLKAPYIPVAPNSNSLIATVWKAGGQQIPEGLGFFGGTFAPGTKNILDIPLLDNINSGISTQFERNIKLSYGLGGALQIGCTGFDVWNIVNIAQHPDPINDPDNYKLWSAVARSVPTEAGFWGSTVYGAVKAYDKYKPFAALEGGLKLGSRAAVPAMAAGTAAQIGYGIYEDGGKFGPHTQDVVYSNQRALLGAGVGGVVGAGLGALVPGLNLTGTSEWAGFVLGAEIGYGVGSLMDAGAAMIGEENSNPTPGAVLRCGLDTALVGDDYVEQELCPCLYPETIFLAGMRSSPTRGGNGAMKRSSQ